MSMRPTACAAALSHMALHGKARGRLPWPQVSPPFLQNSLKASNRKKKRTSFKRKASKRGTEVSASRSPAYRSVPGLPGCGPCLLLGCISSHSSLLPSPLTTLNFRVFLDIQPPATSQSICLVCGSLIPKTVKAETRANTSRMLRVYRITPKSMA